MIKIIHQSFVHTYIHTYIQVISCLDFVIMIDYVYIDDDSV